MLAVLLDFQSSNKKKLDFGNTRPHNCKVHIFKIYESLKISELHMFILYKYIRDIYKIHPKNFNFFDLAHMEKDIFTKKTFL